MNRTFLLAILFTSLCHADFSNYHDAKPPSRNDITASSLSISLQLSHTAHSFELNFAPLRSNPRRNETTRFRAAWRPFLEKLTVCGIVYDYDLHAVKAKPNSNEAFLSIIYLNEFIEYYLTILRFQKARTLFKFRNDDVSPLIIFVIGKHLPRAMANLLSYYYAQRLIQLRFLSVNEAELGRAAYTALAAAECAVRAKQRHVERALVVQSNQFVLFNGGDLDHELGVPTSLLQALQRARIRTATTTTTTTNNTTSTISALPITPVLPWLNTSVALMNNPFIARLTTLKPALVATTTAGTSFPPVLIDTTSDTNSKRLNATMQETIQLLRAITAFYSTSTPINLTSTSILDTFMEIQPLTSAATYITKPFSFPSSLNGVAHDTLIHLLTRSSFIHQAYTQARATLERNALPQPSPSFYGEEEWQKQKLLRSGGSEEQSVHQIASSSSQFASALIKPPQRRQSESSEPVLISICVHQSPTLARRVIENVLNFTERSTVIVVHLSIAPLNDSAVQPYHERPAIRLHHNNAFKMPRHSAPTSTSSSSSSFTSSSSSTSSSSFNVYFDSDNTTGATATTNFTFPSAKHYRQYRRRIQEAQDLFEFNNDWQWLDKHPRVLLNSNHYEVRPFWGGTILRAHLSNVEYALRTPLGRRARFALLQPANCPLIRRGVEVYVRAARAACATPRTPQATHFERVARGWPAGHWERLRADESFIRVLNRNRTQTFVKMLHEGSFYPMDILIDFIALLRSHGMLEEMVERHYVVEEVWLPTFFVRYHTHEIARRKCAHPVCRVDFSSGKGHVAPDKKLLSRLIGGGGAGEGGGGARLAQHVFGLKWAQLDAPRTNKAAQYLIHLGTKASKQQQKGNNTRA